MLIPLSSFGTHRKFDFVNARARAGSIKQKVIGNSCHRGDKLFDHFHQYGMMVGIAHAVENAAIRDHFVCVDLLFHREAEHFGEVLEDSFRISGHHAHACTDCRTA